MNRHRSLSTPRASRVLKRLATAECHLRTIAISMVATSILWWTPSASAATATWTANANKNGWDDQSIFLNGDGSTTTKRNWTISPFPGAGDDVVFNNGALLNPIRTIDLEGDRTVRQVTFTNNAFTLDSAVGANTLTLQLGRVTASGGNHVINANVHQAATGIWSLVGSVRVNGAFTGTGALTKFGNGTLTLAGTNQLTSRINAVSGRVVTDLEHTGVIDVDANCTLAPLDPDGDLVVARIIGDGSVEIEGGTILGDVAPNGSSPEATMTFPENLTLDGKFLCEVSGSRSDRLAVNGALDLTNTTLQVTSNAAAGALTIATFSQRIGEFAAVQGLPAGYELFYEPNQIVLAAPQRYYVNAAANGNDDGTSWADAFDGLQDALAVATEYDEIWVAAGTYLPTDDGDRDVSFELVNGVEIYGGFLGTEGLLEERNPALNVTILSGDLDQDDVGGAPDGDNSYNVVFCRDVDATTILDGFTIMAGNATGGGSNAGLTGNGAGLNSQNSSLQVSNCRFTGNVTTSEGGGVFAFSGGAKFINCLFSGNAAESGGAGTLVLGSPEFINSTFSGNQASLKGGVINLIATGSPKFTNSILWNNVAGGSTSSPSASLFNGGASPVFSHSLVENWSDTALGGSGNLDGTDANNDPQFLTVLNPATAPTLGGDFRCPVGSVVIDAGLNSANPETRDLGWNDRKADGDLDSVSVIDIGAFEKIRTPPTLVLNGENPMMVECGDSYSEPGAVATDEFGVDLSAQIQIDTSGVDAGSVGTYAVSYSVTDANGLSSQATRTVNVVDTTSPTITLIGESRIVLRTGDSFVDPGVTVTDNCSEAVSAVVGGDTVDTNVPGVYTITYDATDSSSNSALRAFRVVVVADTSTVYVAPSFTDDDGGFVSWTGSGSQVDGLSSGFNAFDSLAAAVAAVDGGGTVRIGPGTYTLNTTILVSKSLTLKGEGASTTAISGDSSVRILRVVGGSLDIRIEGLTLTAGAATTGSGGAIQDVNGSNLVFSGVEVTHSSAPRGGAVSGSGNLIIGDSTFAANDATNEGGAIFFTGDLIAVFNSTFSGNSANSGAAISSSNDDPSSITNATIVANVNRSSTSTIRADDEILEMVNTIYKGNTGTAGVAADAYNSVTSLGSNISAFTNVSLSEVVNPVLADNGGPTRTHAPVLGGRAINRGNPAKRPADLTDQDGDGNVSERAPFDQRGAGFPRDLDGSVDIGAVEVDLLPEVTNVTPASGSVGLPVDAVFEVDFNQEMQLGSGNLEIVRIPDGVILNSLPMSDPQITVSGSRFTLNLSSPLPTATRFLIDLPAGAVSDLSGNRFAGTTLVYSTIVPETWISEALVITTDNGVPGTLDAGDVVTWKAGSPDQVSGLVFGLNAFESVETGILAVESGGQVNMASGLYSTSGTIEIDKSLTIIGDGADRTSISGADTHTVFHITASGPTDIVTLRDLTVRNGSSTVGAGGILCESANQVRLINLGVTESISRSGGGIFLFGSEALIANCSIYGNTGQDLGAGIAVQTGSVATIINSTVSGNRFNGTGSGNGAGIAASGGSQVTLRHCTVSQNETTNKTGGILLDGATCTISNCLVLGNTGSKDVSGSFASEGGNFIGVPGNASGFLPVDTTLASAGATVGEVIDPVLGDNGGPTPTHALPAASPAIDLGLSGGVPSDLSDADEDGNLSEDAPSDQRGEERVVNQTPDSGAVEANLAPFLVSSDLNGLELTLNFLQSVTEGSGSAFVRDGNTFDILSTIPASSWTFNGSKVTIPLPDAVPAGTSILVSIEAGAIQSGSGVDYDGLGGYDSLSFATAFDTVYVAQAGRFSPINPTEGQEVTWSNLSFDATKIVPGLIFGTNAFTSIQEAIDNVRAGGTIELANGRYEEGTALDIAKDVVLIGQSESSTILDASGGHRILSTTGNSDLTVRTLVFLDGSGSNGGAIHHDATGELTLIDCRFIRNGSPLFIGMNGTATLMRCSLSRSTTDHAIINQGQLKVYNSTIGNGTGGIQNFGAATVLQATIVNNSNPGISNESGGTMEIGNSVLTDNTTYDLAGSFTSLGSNFIDGVEFPGNLDVSDLSYSSTSAVDSGDLFENPSGTGDVYHLLQSGPLFNAGATANIPPDIDDADTDLDTTEPAPFNQLGAGFPRVDEGQVDVGAIELIIEPNLLASIPARDFQKVPTASTFFFQFDRAVFAGSGSIFFKRRSTDEIIDSFDVLGSEVAFSGSDVIVTPDTPLPESTSFYLEIGPGVIVDSTGDDFAGTNQDFWSYRTAPVFIYLDEPLDFTVQEGDPDLLTNGTPVTWNGPEGDVTDLVFGVNAFVSLQRAIDEAGEGTTIRLAAGLWDSRWDTGPITIDKAVTLSGAGTESTFVRAEDGLPAFSVTHTGAVIENLTILSQDPYSAWTTINYPGVTNPSTIGLNADPQGIGVTNGIAFLTGTSPFVLDSASRPQITRSATTLTLTFRESDAADVYGPFYEFSTNLTGWHRIDAQTEGITVTVIENGAIDSVEVEIDTTRFDQCFVRQRLAVP